MGLRIFGGVAALALFAFAMLRYRKGQLGRGELLAVGAVVAGLSVAAVAPSLLDPLLSALGFERGQERRIIGLLVISNLFTLALLFRGFSRQDQASDEIGDLVDYMALRRLQDEGLPLALDACGVVIPAFNEADNIGSVLPAIPRTVEGLSVVPIVVADGCTDDTEATARSLGAIVIRRDLRRGSGAAVRLGFMGALKLGARVIVTMDADGQHDPSEIHRLVRPIVRDGVDMVQGSRVLGSFEVESKIRRYGVTLFSKLLTALSRTRITDPSNGYRAINAASLMRLDLRQEQFYVSEVILEAARRDLKVLEVPITVRRRATGITKKPSALRYALGFARAIARTWLRQPTGPRPVPLEPRWISNFGDLPTQQTRPARDLSDAAAHDG